MQKKERKKETFSFFYFLVSIVKFVNNMTGCDPKRLKSLFFLQVDFNIYMCVKYWIVQITLNAVTKLYKLKWAELLIIPDGYSAFCIIFMSTRNEIKEAQ